LIPTGTYYTVNLTSRQGSQVAGFPQSWCTYGGAGGVINVSNGAPTGNCNVNGVFYPTPIMANPQSGVQALSGNLNMGGALSDSNPGVFTNTQANMYMVSQVGTTGPGPFFLASQGGYMTDAFTGIVTAPAGSTAHEFDGGDFACLTAAVSSPLGANENCVGVYGAGRNQANNTAAWAANFTMGDATGYTGFLAIGNEIDVGLAATSQPTRFQGVFVTGNSLAFSGGGAMASGPVMGTLNVASNSASAYGLALSGTAGNWQFPVAYWSSKGSAALGIMLDASCYTGACNSQGIQMGGNDGASAHTVGLVANSTGDLVITPDTNRRTISVGGLSIGSTTNQLLFNGTGNTTTISFPNPAAPRTYTFPDPGANAKVGLNLQATSGAYQAVRGVAGCTTGGAAGNPCASPITVTWPATFGDTSYTATCTPSGGAPTNFPGTPYLVTKSAASMTINYIAMTAAAASWPSIDCVAVHD
jgi:hypothetical protein